MTTLHTALAALGPVAWADVPTDNSIKSFVQTQLSNAQLITESVPPPPPSKSSSSSASPRTTPPASATDLSLSPIHSEALPAHAALQKQWGSPVKVAPKDNPLGIPVFKLAAKDGRGAWFARRSVHEGLPFDRWREALQREFPTSLAVQGDPGEGNVRGIGGESRLEDVEVEGLGRVQVYRLSAQFPGPTTPRDFVTLLLTSSDALLTAEPHPYATRAPRHFIVISRPCAHAGAPPQTGLIRGSYESVEIVREVPRAQGLRSATDLRSRADSLRRGSAAGSAPTRSRGSSIAETRGADAPAADPDPVEWVMVTRSDPGGSVPRFMVERGTPASIVADARKFLDWACKGEFDGAGDGQDRPRPERHASLAGVSAQRAPRRLSSSEEEDEEDEAAQAPAPAPHEQEAERDGDGGGGDQAQSKTLLDMAQAAYAGLESYASQTLSGLAQSGSSLRSPSPVPSSPTLSSPSSSAASFASAEDDLGQPPASPVPSSASKEDRELLKLAASMRARQAQTARSAADRDADRARRAEQKEAEKARKAQEKEAERARKAEEKEAQRAKKAEERALKEQRKKEEREERDARKERENEAAEERGQLRRKVKEVETQRDELKGEVEELRKEVERLRGELGVGEGEAKVSAEHGGDDGGAEKSSGQGE